jgi:hypothetical protein
MIYDTVPVSTVVIKNGWSDLAPASLGMALDTADPELLTSSDSLVPLLADDVWYDYDGMLIDINSFNFDTIAFKAAEDVGAVIIQMDPPRYSLEALEALVL